VDRARRLRMVGSPREARPCVQAGDLARPALAEAPASTERNPKPSVSEDYGFRSALAGASASAGRARSPALDA